MLKVLREHFATKDRETLHAFICDHLWGEIRELLCAGAIIDRVDLILEQVDAKLSALSLPQLVDVAAEVVVSQVEVERMKYERACLMHQTGCGSGGYHENFEAA